jgi:hypothetical protein
MPNLARSLIGLLIICSSALALNSHAYNVADVELSEVVPATAERPELSLNGASLRELYLLVETYVGALYLENPSTKPKEIIESESHKRMVFHVMLKKVGARRIANALQEALVVNLTEEEHKELTPKLDQMLSHFNGKMHAGEEAIFDYIPGLGTRITINNEVKGVITGKKYFQAMLSIWVGENPVGRNFKEDILGLNRKAASASLMADN